VPSKEIMNASVPHYFDDACDKISKKFFKENEKK